jgi:hypothetical protein
MQDKLGAIKNELFPIPHREGEMTVVNHVDDNLEGVLEDLKRKWPDQVCINTLENTINRLNKVRAILGMQRE